ncbi:Sorting nexin-14 [Oryzias melastigma]|uniref:Sorting nexin-14 n=1 Tax=Oryzias melastigma TaxID=30732 RepID=A0A834C5F9_ORYME|nr:Sorting nexin-14 [Oryzias melastigma]
MKTVLGGRGSWTGRYFVGKCIGEEAKHEGVRLLFDALQQPLLNKQMAYVLLDIAVLELFPELNKMSEPALNASRFRLLYLLLNSHEFGLQRTKTSIL